MAEDGKIVYRITIDDSGATIKAEEAGKRAGEAFGSGAGAMDEIWTGAARRVGEAFVNMAFEAARQVKNLIVGAIQTGMDFDAAMSQVAATLGYSMTDLNTEGTEAYETMKTLRDFAREMGNKTQYTAEEAANALNYMALAGYDAETSMAMLPTVLNLAAAGGMDLARASDAVTDIQSALGLTIDETTTMVDQMARTSQKTNTSVSQLAEAMLTVGGTAAFMAGGTAEITTALGIMASAGVKGAEGGTHLRNILLSLSAPTENGAKALEELGVQLFDAEGNMRSFADFFPELQAAMEGMTEEQKLGYLDTLFNKRDIAAVMALLNTTSDEWARLMGLITDSDGAAQGMSETMLDNLKGDVTILQSAWSNFLIELSDKFAPILREIMPDLLALVNRLTERLHDADWSGMGNTILTIAEKIVGFLEWIIDNSDTFIHIVETIGAAFIGNKIKGLFGGSSGTSGGLLSFLAGKATGTAAGGAAGAAAGGTAGAGALSGAGMSAALALPATLLWGGAMGVRDYLNARKAALGGATLGEGATVEEIQANVERLRAEVAEAQAFYTERENMELWGDPADGQYLLSKATAELDAKRAALKQAEEELAAAQAEAADDAGADLQATAEEAGAWGEDLVHNFAAGVASAAGSDLLPTLIGVGGLIAAYLKHSTPDRGPLADDDTWMPDMVQGWANQIEQYSPALADALSGALPTSGDFERSVSIQMTGGDRRVIEVPVNLNGREIARATAWDMGEQLAWEEL